MKATVIIDSEVSAKDTKRGKRIWFRSDLLTKRCGLRVGDKFRVVQQHNRIRLIKDANGTLGVTMSRGKPSFDLHNKGVATSFPDAARVFIELSLHEIVIAVRRTDEALHQRVSNFKQRMKDNAPLLLGDLCSGIGGLALSLISGFVKSGQGVRAEFAIDHDFGTLEAATLSNPAYDDDTLMMSCSLEQAPLERLNQVDVLTVGLSCKGASKQARTGRKISAPEYHAEAGWLVMCLPTIINKVSPLMMIVENVVEWSDTVSCHILKEFMSRIGYTYKEQILQGGDFGALEHRKRYGLVFVSNGIELDLTLPAPVEAQECIADILEPSDCFNPVPDSTDCAEKDRKGWYPKEVLLRRQEEAIEKGKGHRAKIINPEDKKLSTITASYGKGVRLDESVVESDCGKWLRLMSPVEHARAKRLPEVLASTLSKTNAHKALGNSVEGLCWEWLGQTCGLSLIEAASTLVDYTVESELDVHSTVEISQSVKVIEQVEVIKPSAAIEEVEEVVITAAVIQAEPVIEPAIALIEVQAQPAALKEGQLQAKEVYLTEQTSDPLSCNADDALVWIMLRTEEGEVLKFNKPCPMRLIDRAKNLVDKIKDNGLVVNKALWSVAENTLVA